MTKDYCYCAICGAPCGCLEWDLLDNTRYYRPILVEEETVDWLTDVKLLTLDPDSGRAIEYHGVEHEHGRTFIRTDDHFNYEEEAYVEVYQVTTYRPLVIPFHAACHDLIQKAEGGKIDLQALYKALEPRCTKKNHLDPTALDYNYGPVGKLQCGGSWMIRKDTEYAVMSPTDIGDCSELVNAAVNKAGKAAPPAGTSTDRRAPTHGPSGPAGSRPHSSHVSSHNYRTAPYPGNRGACHYNHCATYGPSGNFTCQQIRGSQSNEVGSSNSLWKKKFYEDMGWIAEFLPSASDLERGHISWQSLYESAQAIANGQPPGDPKALEGLRNRSRIWRVCKEILQDYAPCRRTRSAQLTHPHCLFEELRWTSCKPSATDTPLWSNAAFIQTFNDVINAEPCISVHWGKDGSLTGIRVKTSELAKPKVLGSPNNFYSEDNCKIAKSDWLRKVDVFTTSSKDEYCDTKITGLKFYFTHGKPAQFGQAGSGKAESHVPKLGTFAIGVSARWSSGQRLTHLQLCSQPIGKAPSESYGRLIREEEYVCDSESESSEVEEY